MRQNIMLPQLPARIYSCIHQDGKGTKSIIKSNKNIWCVWQTDVLLEKRRRNL